MSSYGYKSIGTMKDNAEQAIENAIRLDPTLGEAYASKGLLLTQLGGETKDIVALYEKALELNPNNSLAHMWLGGQLGLSDLDGTLQHLRTAYALDPLSGVVLLNLANILMVAGHTEEARQRTEELLQLDPTWPGAQRLLAQNAITAGDAYGWIQGNLRALELDEGDTAHEQVEQQRCWSHHVRIEAEQGHERQVTAGPTVTHTGVQHGHDQQQQREPDLVHAWCMGLIGVSTGSSVPGPRKRIQRPFSTSKRSIIPQSPSPPRRRSSIRIIIRLAAIVVTETGTSRISQPSCSSAG